MFKVSRWSGAQGWLVLALVAGCGGAAPEPEAPKSAEEADSVKAQRLLDRARKDGAEAGYRKIVERFPDTPAANEAKEELAAIVVVDAEKALAEQDHARAEQRADEARRFGGLATTERARKVLDTVDDQRSEQHSAEAAQLIADGKCASAVKRVAGWASSKPRDRYRKALQEKTRGPLLGCLRARIEEELKAGNQAAARALVDAPEAKAALSKAGWAELDRTLLKLVVRGSLASLEPAMKAARWKDALAQLTAMQTSQVLKEEEHAAAVEIVQDAAREHLIAFARAAIVGRGPGAALRSIAEQLEAAEIARPPDELLRLQGLLEVAAQCEKVGCKMKPSDTMWAWGTIVVREPRNATEGQKVGKVVHAQKVWVLGRSATHALVITKEPGKLDVMAAFEQATGWVETAHLRPADTVGWMPPVEDLVGFRVWGPLRAPAKEFHLGTVTKVQGDKATVRRMSDGLETEVAIRDLRAGTIPAGVRVMAFCTDELHPEEAKIDSVTLEGETPKVKVQCKGGKTRVEVASALSSRAEWLPPRRP